MMDIRRAIAADAAPLADLTRRAYAGWTALMGVAPTPVAADYAGLIAGAEGAECWILDGKAGLLAGLTLKGKPDHFEVYSIVVDPAAHGGGLGRNLMAYAETRARALGYRKISLFTNIKMVANRAFYGRLGYEETGRIFPMGRQAVTMAKRLDVNSMDTSERVPMTNDLYAQRRAAYRDLHRSGCFVQPNPWDAGTARWLRAKGFPALATTSAGFAWTRGRPDMDVPLDMMLGYIADIVEAVPDLPVNADFEDGYADDDETMARNIKLCVATGVAGLSIEDATGDPARPIHYFETALRRFKVARRAVDETGSGVMLTARAEAYLHGHPEPLPEVCRRIAAFAEAGADVLYAPGPRTKADMREVIAAAGGKPVNIIVFADIGMTVDEIAELGARRISIGSALAKAAWTGFVTATEELTKGSFTGFGPNMASAPLNDFFAVDLKDRGVT